MPYKQCPHCGNIDVGNIISQCHNGHVYCLRCDTVDYDCPICRESGIPLGEIEEEGEELRDQIVELTRAKIEASESSSRAEERRAYLENNPGDYQCPWCKMISLKYEALCCPRCRRDVGDFYWKEIHERKRLEKEREEAAKRKAEQEHQRYLASPEYAEESKRKKLAEETCARDLAEKKRKDAENIKNREYAESAAKIKRRVIGTLLILISLGCCFGPHKGSDILGDLVVGLCAAMFGVIVLTGGLG